MATSREEHVWTNHAAEQMAMQAYVPEAPPGRLRSVLESELWESVLDFGCGTALWRPHFQHGRYVGLDQNEAMIAGARKRFPNDEFVLCPGISDGAKIPLGDETFEIVFTAAVLQHSTDADKVGVLREVRRVLQVGGRLICFENTFWEGNPGQEDGYSHTQSGWKTFIEPFGFLRILVDGDLHVFRAV